MERKVETRMGDGGGERTGRGERERENRKRGRGEGGRGNSSLMRKQQPPLGSAGNEY